MSKTGCGEASPKYSKKVRVSDRKPYHKPPKLAEFLLCWILPDGIWETPLGDFEEFYNSIAGEKGVFLAKIWYWKQILKLIPVKIINLSYWSSDV